jgi:hypothetical protein
MRRHTVRSTELPPPVQYLPAKVEAGRQALISLLCLERTMRQPAPTARAASCSSSCSAPTAHPHCRPCSSGRHLRSNVLLIALPLCSSAIPCLRTSKGASRRRTPRGSPCLSSTSEAAGPWHLQAKPQPPRQNLRDQACLWIWDGSHNLVRIALRVQALVGRIPSRRSQHHARNQ